MALFIEVIRGPDMGARFPIKNGYRMGRKVGDILLTDSRISSVHAQIEKDSRGNLALVDLNSSNGLEINSQRVKRIVLFPGTTFRAGDSEFKVVEEKAPIIEAAKWETAFEQFLNSSQLRKSFTVVANQSLRPFVHPIELTFTEGIQADTTWTIGWGPRTVGRDTIEYRLLEPIAPSEAFQIFPNESGIPIFSTKFDSMVLLNGRTTPSKQINERDYIKIGSSVMLITFLKNGNASNRNE